MIGQIILVCTSLIMANTSAYSQQSPPNAEKAKQIEALVNRAASIVETEGKAAFAKFRERGSEWWTGDVYVFSYSPEASPHGRDVPTTERQIRWARL